MFQFEILPWNRKAIPANMPFTAPRIIGIERKFNYALYDLLLLLIIFLHRYLLYVVLLYPVLFDLLCNKPKMKVNMYFETFSLNFFLSIMTYLNYCGAIFCILIWLFSIMSVCFNCNLIITIYPLPVRLYS